MARGRSFAEASGHTRRRAAAALATLGVANGLAAGCGADVVVSREEALVSDAGAPPVEAGTDARDAAAPPAEGGELRCGDTRCGPVDLGIGFGTLEPCCFNSRCGAALSSLCIEVDAPGVANPSCPSLGPYSGCCRRDGVCGLIVIGTLLGCVDPFTLVPGASFGTCVYPDE